MNESLLLDLYHHPTHFAEHKRYTHRSKVENVHCGDEIALQLLLIDGVMKKVTFCGTACSLCLATAEYLCRQLQGKPAIALKQIAKTEILKEFDVDEQHKRIRCFTLPFEAIDSLITVLQKEKSL
jgi:NifU-like protein involved in Fe-S cluster formation